MSTCANCRTSIRHGEKFGCCTCCGRMFAGGRAFDAHWQSGDPRQCSDAEMVPYAPGTVRAGRRKFEAVEHPSGGVYWRLVSDGVNPWAAERASDALKQADPCTGASDGSQALTAGPRGAHGHVPAPSSAGAS